MKQLEDFISNLPRNPGLVFGENITIQGTRAEFAAAIETVLTRPVSIMELPALLDVLSDTDILEREKIEEAWREYLRKATKSLELPFLAKAGWSACVSATKDLLFEGELTSHLESIPASKTVTIVDSPKVRIPPRSIPVYKLYGSLNSADPERKLVFSDADMMIRKESWAVLLRSLPDQLRGAPVVFIGVPVDVAKLVLSTLSAQPHPRVREIFYIDGDPAFNDPTVKRLCSTFSVEPLDASFRELCNAIAEFKGVRLNSAGKKASGEFEVAYSSIVNVVPAGPTTLDFESHRNALIDALFRPKSAIWDPYKLQLDLERTVSDVILSSIFEALDQANHGPKTIFIRGEAAVGKTVVAKNVAVKLADKDVFVTWARTAPFNWRVLYREMIKQLRKQNDIKYFVIICDDPHALKIDSGEVLSALEDLGIPAVMVIVSRNTDYFGFDSEVTRVSISESIEVPFDLSEEETSRWPRFLNRLGIAESEQQGRNLIGSIGTRAASDVLCSLWYLVPATKSQIADSLRDQYLRLGDSKGTIQSVAQSAANSSDIAQRAYEFVTASSALGVGLPLEVLIRALDIDYQDWIEMCVEGRPLWGLLYDDMSEDGDTIEYWTRNEVVTQVLLDLLNGGVGNAGQAHVLGKLISVCSESSAVYRDFVVDIMVRSRKRLEAVLTFRQGMELYTLAESALGVSDRTLEFHKGIWMQHKGTDLASAYSQMTRALSLPSLSEAGQNAPDEHIHTSMAATVLDMVRKGDIDQFKGIEQIREHLRHAASAKFINPHSAHVTARMLFDIAQSKALKDVDDLRLECFGQALAEIEKALQLIGADRKSKIRDTSSIEYLRTLQNEILEKMPSEQALRELAEEMFKTDNNQAGYAALVRRAVASASVRNKGTDYNAAFQLIANITSEIDKANEQIGLDIIASRVDLIVRWRLQRTGGPVDWKLLKEDLDKLLSQLVYQDSLIKNFLSAVVYFHLEDISRSTAKFANLRRIAIARHAQRTIRAYYLNKEGQPRRVQFTLVHRAGRFYLESPHIGIDIPINQMPGSLRPGDTTHAYIGFSLLGPTAVFERPAESHLLLP